MSARETPRRANFQEEDSANQANRDSTQPGRHKNEIAQRHHQRSTLIQLLPAGRDRVEQMTSALIRTPGGSQADGEPGLGAPWLEPTPEWSPGQPGPQPLPADLDAWLAERDDDLVALRRHLHANPELSGREFETAALVAARLEAAGLDPKPLPAGNGVICDIPGTGDNDRVIALRADLDALPMLDAKDVPYRSTVDGACH